MSKKPIWKSKTVWSGLFMAVLMLSSIFTGEVVQITEMTQIATENAPAIEEATEVISDDGIIDWRKLGAAILTVLLFMTNLFGRFTATQPLRVR